MRGRGLKWAAVALLAAVWACGYSLKGTVNNLPRDVRRLAILPLENSSTKVGLGTMLTDELRYQFTLSKVLKLTGPDVADAALLGRIRSVRTEGSTIRGATGTASRRLVIVVAATLKRTRDGEILWRDTNIVGRKTFAVSGDQLTTERNEEAAMAELAKDLAAMIHDRIFENF